LAPHRSGELETRPFGPCWCRSPLPFGSCGASGPKLSRPMPGINLLWKLFPTTTVAASPCRKQEENRACEQSDACSTPSSSINSISCADGLLAEQTVDLGRRLGDPAGRSAIRGRATPSDAVGQRDRGNLGRHHGPATSADSSAGSPPKSTEAAWAACCAATLAVHQRGEFVGQGARAVRRSGACRVLVQQRFDLDQRLQRQHSQVGAHHLVVALIQNWRNWYGGGGAPGRATPSHRRSCRNLLPSAPSASADG